MDPEPSVPAPRRRGRPPKAKYWDPQPPPKPSTSTMVTRSRASQLTQQSMGEQTHETEPEIIEVNKIINNKKQLLAKRKAKLHKIPKGWTQAQYENFMATGDIYKGQFPRHTVICEPTIDDIVPPPVLTSDSDSHHSDFFDSDPDLDSDSSEELGVIPGPRSPYPPTARSESDHSGESTPHGYTPLTTDTEADFDTPVGGSNRSSSDSDHPRGAASSESHEQTVVQKNPSTSDSDSPDPSNISRPVAKSSGLGGLLKDFGDYLVGAQPKAGPSHPAKRARIPSATSRSTRSAGPAPEISLPRVPIERGRGSSRSRGSSRASSNSVTSSRGASRPTSRGSRSTSSTREKSPSQSK